MARRIMLEVLHNTEGGSDKVYILELIQNKLMDGSYVYDVIASYGRRTARSLIHLSKGRYNHLSEAQLCTTGMVREKCAGGYRWLSLPERANILIPGFDFSSSDITNNAVAGRTGGTILTVREYMGQHPKNVGEILNNRGQVAPTPQPEPAKEFRRMRLNV